MSEYLNKKVVIIRQRGMPNSGKLPDGRDVHRLERVFLSEYNGFIPCAQYSDHFIYEMPRDVLGSVYMCSCGAPAIIVGLSGYVHDASSQGKLMVCLGHSSSGQHYTGGSRWI
jgi:hypothetical protein